MKPLLARMLATVCVLCAGPVHAETLNIYNWADYFGEKTVDDFKAETGVGVTLDYFDSNETLETKMLTGGSGYDLVFPATSNAQREFAAGALAPIDPTRLKNYGNLDPAILKALDAVPGGRQMGVPYTWGTIGIAYNVDKVKQRLGVDHLDSLDVFFKPETAAKLSDCGMVMLDSPLEISAVTLNYLGAAPYGEDKDALAKAETLLEATTKSLRYFNNQRATNDLASGDICAALIYSGDAWIAKSRAEEAHNGVVIDYAIPREGTLMWVDLMAIPADAPHADQAYRFIDYMLRPEVMAGVTDFVGFANANAAATPQVDPAITGNPALYPDPTTMAHLFPDKSVDAGLLRERTRMWTKVKTGM
ncbi:extracellular solute-binding protein [Oryzibacter oryziterrae]|uniref:extracellular solute-binding protein n=1 Tax=Oryzibacter oryziterrae TaxID=2766474 RepID=UPI001F46503B|nr:extracellular solute-binding protein [Oryzibacter oryziterrae]